MTPKGNGLIRRLVLSGTTLVLIMAAGCVAHRHFPPPNLPPTARVVPADHQPLPARPPWPVVPAAGSAPARTRAVLAVSGGGLYGAYTVGVLKGWSAAGSRPNFDVATGVSTGALIATLAFLGPEYDDQLEEWYTTAKPRDVFRRRSLPALFWSESLADSWPLRERIERVVTPEFLDRIAREQATGRRLYVGTTNLDTRRLVVWDMTAIAAGDTPNRLELFRRILLASCSIPGLMPPVALDVEVDGKRRTELHVDGGVSALMFVPSCAVSSSDSAVYVIVSGKVAASGRAVPLGIVNITEASLDGVFRAQIRSDLQRIAALAQGVGSSFAYAAVPEEFGSAAASMSLKAKVLQQLFDEGYRCGTAGPAWRRSPPELDADAPAPPRTGTRLTVVKDPAPAAGNPAK